MRDADIEASQSRTGIPAELMIWLSPAFPVGGFAYSQGLETAVANGWVSDPAGLAHWLRALAHFGALRNDLILLGLTMRSQKQSALVEIAELALALQPSAERAQDSRDQGRSFWMAYSAAWRPQPSEAWPDADELALPVAVGLAAREHEFDTRATLEAYAMSFISNQVSAAIRLGIAGQFDGQRVIAQLLPELRAIAEFSAAASVDDLGTSTYGADLASLLHETQTTRLFRS